MMKKKECDCAHFPWQPAQCVKICGGILIARVSDDYLIATLELEPGIVEKISTSSRRKTLESLDALAGVLSEDELLEVIARVRAYSEKMGATLKVLTEAGVEASAQDRVMNDS